MPELWLAFITGLVSSLHCVGMCGPMISGCFAGQVQATPVTIDLPGVKKRRFADVVIPQSLYHGGRFISYAMIGMIAGGLGSFLFISDSLRQTVAIVLGALMIVASLFQMNFFSLKGTSLVGRKITNVLTALTRSDLKESKLLLGLVTPLLPCGLLYGMVLQAAATHSPVSGALVLGSFALGTVPALAGVVAVIERLSLRIRKYGSTIAAIFIMVMGIVTICRGLGIYHDPFTPAEKSCCSPGTHHSEIK